MKFSIKFHHFQISVENPYLFIVHRQFNLNVTVIYYITEYEISEIDELYLSGKKYKGLIFPFTFISSSNSLEIAFPFDAEICIGIEYSICQRFNGTNYRRMETNGMYFLWGYFLVTCFRIHVDMTARLALNTASCFGCKLVVYDGPTGKVPVILKSNGAGKYHRVVASAFQVFVVLVEDGHQKEAVIIYAPVYISTAVYNLSKSDYVEISFDNRTHCHGSSLYARLCVFVFHTSGGRMIRFSLTDLQFSGKYSGSRYTAGIVFFNHFNGTTDKMVEMNTNLKFGEATNFEIIGTSSKMLVSVFEYFILASITLTFAASTKSCNTFLVSDNYISHSGYITPVLGKRNVSQIDKPSHDLLKYHICYRFQFLHMKPSQHRFKFLVSDDVNPMLVTTGNTQLNQYAWRNRCTFYMQRLQHRTYFLDNLERKGIFSIKSFEVEFCDGLQYSHLQIMTLPCRIPCPHIVQEKYCHPNNYEPNVGWANSVNTTCDVCENTYIFCKTVRLASSILPRIRIKSKVCKYASSVMSTYRPVTLEMTLTFNRTDILSALSDFKTETNIYLRSTSCVVEIPISAIVSVKTNIYRKTTPHVVKTFQWGGALYHSMHHQPPVSWEAAAAYCKKFGASLLTIHSQAEYRFVKETFLKTYDVLVLYVGVKRKVQYL